MLQPSDVQRLVIVAALGAAALTAAGLALWAKTPQPQLVLQPLGERGGADVGELVGRSPEGRPA